MSKENFYTEVDEGRAAFIKNMKIDREEVEVPDFDIPGFEDEEEDLDPEEQNDKSGANRPEDTLTLDYNDAQLWSAELTLMKLDEVIAGLISVYTGKNAAKYQRWNKAEAKTKEREAQLLAAIFNKYQMRMSLEYAFLSLMVMAYAPTFLEASQDRKAKKKETIRANGGAASDPKKGAIG